MSAKNSASSKKKSTSKTAAPKEQPLNRWQKIRRAIKAPFGRIARRTRAFLARRPHRSFRRTRRRDYVRSWKMPGYWSFTNYVRKTLWQHKKMFVWLVVIYGALTIVLVGVASQDTYSQLSDLLRSTSGDIFKGNWGEIGKAGLLLASGAMGQLNMSLTQVQQMYAVIIVLFAWLTTVWLLRAVLAGRKPRFRDGLYNAGAPILSTFLVTLLLVIQLLPVVLAVIGFTALTPFGILDGGVESMIFWAAAVLLVALSLYWITSTLIALVVITLPGMYPWQAIKTAGDLVVGRRIRVLLRLLWMFFIIVLVWAVIMIPIILVDTWLKGIFPAIQWLPTVPVALLILGTITIIWMASYVYLLYRRIVDDDAAPA